MNLLLLWSLALGIVVCAVVATIASAGGEDKRLVRVVPWAVALAATTAVAIASWDQTHVSQDELDGAVQRVAEQLDGASYVVPPRELRRQVSEQLDSPVDMYTTPNDAPNTVDVQRTFYEVQERATEGGPTGCLTVTVTRADAGDPGSMALDASSGPC